MLKPENPRELQAAEREEGAAACWQAGVELEGFSYSLVVKIKLVMCEYAQEDPNISLGGWGQIAQRRQ